MDQTIYALQDPRDRSIRYVGASADPERRLYQHVYYSQHTKSRKDLWLKELTRNSLRPTLLELEIASETNWKSRETYWINNYQSSVLTNDLRRAGAGRTVNSAKEIPMITEKKCKGPCAQTLPIDSFHWKSKRKGTRQARCKSCMSDYGHQHYVANSQEYKDRANSRLKTLRASNRDLVKTYIQANPCSKCGEANPRVLTTPITSVEINNVATEVLAAKLVPSAVLCRNCLASQD